MQIGNRRDFVIRAVLVVGCLLGGLQAFAQEDAPKIYDEDADAKAKIAQAVAKAEKNNKRVLIVYGRNDHEGCMDLHKMFLDRGTGVARTVLYEYEVVPVHVGQLDKNLDIAERYGSEIKSGIPYMTILGGDGKVVTHQEEGEHGDPAVLKSFLEKWKTEPWDAEKVYQDALGRAKKEDKRILVHLGAPW